MTENVLVPRCHTCHTTTSADFRCGSCKVTRYCSKDHQTSDWPNHKAICNKIKKSRRKMENEETSLRNDPGDSMTPANPFETSVGDFWAITSTRDYMRARILFVTQMLKVNAHDSVVSCLDHLLDMLRLCRSDNLGVRDMVPGLYLRLNRDQDCYDFIKWYFIEGKSGDYDWGDMSLPFLNLKNEDVLEGVELFEDGWQFTHNIAIILLKLRILLDLRDLTSSSVFHDTDKLNYDTIRLIQDNLAKRSPICSARPELVAPEGLDDRIRLLEDQTNVLFEVVDDANEFFWKGLLLYERHLNTSPSTYTTGTQEEMILLVHNHARSWVETEGALAWVQSKIP